MIGRKSEKKGFTLIEMVLVMAMITIVTGAVLNIARFSDTHKNLTIAADELLANLRIAQSKALVTFQPEDGTQHVCGYGISVKELGDESSGGTYELFYSFATESDFQDNPEFCEDNEALGRYAEALALGKLAVAEVFHLPGGVVFAGDIGESVFFRAPYGESTAGDFVIQKSDGSGSKTIRVSDLGQIEEN